MYNTSTITSTYTVVDIRKTFEGCEADIRMIARRTGKWSMTYVDQVFHDILKFAEEEYLSAVDIVLLDAADKPIMATKFTVNANGTATVSDRAGANDWTDIQNTRLTVILSHTAKWHGLTPEQQAKFQSDNSFAINWVASAIDNTFPHLNKAQGQLYASKGFELQKQNFK